jgi:hypothetical protein
MVELKNGKIIYTIKAGTDTALVLKSSDLPEFDEVKMDFKNIEKLDADPIISFSNITGGIQVETEGSNTILTIPISNEITASLKSGRLYFDIKFRFGNVVSDIVVPGEIIRQNTVTRI